MRGGLTNDDAFRLTTAASRWSDDGALASIVLPDDDGVCLKRDRMVTKAPIVL